MSLWCLRIFTLDIDFQPGADASARLEATLDSLGIQGEIDLTGVGKLQFVDAGQYAPPLMCPRCGIADLMEVYTADGEPVSYDLIQRVVDAGDPRLQVLMPCCGQLARPIDFRGSDDYPVGFTRCLVDVVEPDPLEALTAESLGKISALLGASITQMLVQY